MLNLKNQAPNNILYFSVRQKNKIFFCFDNIFMMLGETANKEFRSIADSQSYEFMRQVELKVNIDQKVNEQIFEILLKICQLKGNQNNYAKLNSLVWIFEYLRVFQQEQQVMEEQQKGKLGLQHSPLNLITQSESFTSITPLNSKTSNQQIHGVWESPLRKTILNNLSQILSPVLILISHEEEEVRKLAQKVNDELLKIMNQVKHQSGEFMKIVLQKSQKYFRKLKINQEYFYRLKLQSNFQSQKKQVLKYLS